MRGHARRTRKESEREKKDKKSKVRNRTVKYTVFGGLWLFQCSKANETYLDVLLQRSHVTFILSLHLNHCLNNLGLLVAVML